MASFSLKDISLYDIFITILVFKVVNPLITSLNVFNSSENSKYIAAIITLFFVPLIFNIRTPSVKTLFDSEENFLVRLFVAFMTVKIVVSNPTPKLTLTEL